MAVAYTLNRKFGNNLMCHPVDSRAIVFSSPRRTLEQFLFQRAKRNLARQTKMVARAVLTLLLAVAVAAVSSVPNEREKRGLLQDMFGSLHRVS